MTNQDNSQGFTQTEQLLHQLAKNSFFDLWCFMNPNQSTGKELCDLLVFFENEVILFFDRESKKFDNNNDIDLNWKRWKKKVIDRQISTARGAKKHILSFPDRVFFDHACTKRNNILKNKSNLKVHMIIIAHGAKEACLSQSDENIYGSLGIIYGDCPFPINNPFMINLEKENPVHVFDSENINTLLENLDTITDFLNYLNAKERAIEKYTFLSYSGEEDLLAHYFLNTDPQSKHHFIGITDTDANAIFIEEGEWKSLSSHPMFLSKLEHNKRSYLWDDLISRGLQALQISANHLAEDTLSGKGPLHIMAKESRLARRGIAEQIYKAARSFPRKSSGITSRQTFIMSQKSSIGYLYLQVRISFPEEFPDDHRRIRLLMLDIACGALKNKLPQLETIIGIATEPPMDSSGCEDIILFECSDWPSSKKNYYELENKDFGFFSSTKNLESGITREFPDSDNLPPE